MSTLLEEKEKQLGRKIIRIGRFGECILDEEILSCEASPLTKKSGKTSVTYWRELSERHGKEKFIEEIRLYDPTEYPDHDMATYDGGFSAIVTMLRDDNGTLYPEISIIDGPESFSVWDEKKRKGTSGLKLKTMNELEGLDKERVEKVLEILSDSLPGFAEKSPNNPTLQECMSFFGIQKVSQRGEE